MMSIHRAEAQVIADFPRSDFKNEFIEVQTCSALKKPLTTFGTVNFDYIEYRDPTFHKPNACTRIRYTPWGLAELLCASIQKRSTTPSKRRRCKDSSFILADAACSFADLAGDPVPELGVLVGELAVEAFRWKPFDGGWLWMANGLNVCFCRRLTGCARSQLLTQAV